MSSPVHLAESVLFVLFSVFVPALGSAAVETQRPSLTQRLMTVAVCKAGALGGNKLGEKLADMQAKRVNLPPAQVKALERKYEIGLALALCNGGKLVAGSLYADMSKRDQSSRQKALDAALSDEQSTTSNYVLPDHTNMQGTLTVQPTVADADGECRTIEDHLARGEQGDSALVKYCRKPPATQWAVSTGA